jgi:hypothetical protein
VARVWARPLELEREQVPVPAGRRNDQLAKGAARALGHLKGLDRELASPGKLDAAAREGDDDQQARAGNARARKVLARVGLPPHDARDPARANGAHGQELRDAAVDDAHLVLGAQERERLGHGAAEILDLRRLSTERVHIVQPVGRQRRGAGPRRR